VTVAIDGPVGMIADPVAVAEGHPRRQRALGWLDALKPAGIVPTVVQVRSNHEDAADAAVRSLLAGDQRPTAVLCFSDVLALGVIGTAEDLGLSVPDDLSVVGFDDSPVAAGRKPGLTTVRQDVAAKGRVAAAALTTAIERARSDATVRARHLTLPTELVVRESTARPPQH
jgi:DNA-binding LacI/PurR family transcriptional regulator